MRLTLGVLLLALFAGPTAALDLTVVAYNVESDSDTNPAVVARDLRRIPRSHVWGLSEVSARDFETYREAIGRNFELIAGRTGGSDRLAIVFDARFLEKTGAEELSAAGGSRHPLMATFRIKSSGQEVVVIVNHLQRGNALTREAQATWLNRWAQRNADALEPAATILLGDFNFDVSPRTKRGNVAFDLFMANSLFRWIVPPCVAAKTCPPTGTGCNPRYESILDFVFLAGSARDWAATSKILFQDDAGYCSRERSGGSDHRPVRAVLTLPRRR